MSSASISYRSIETSTNLGPMITPFSFPPDCLSAVFDFQTTIFGQASWSNLMTQGCAMSSCCPSSNIYTADFGWYSSYYSPAVCPERYKTCSGPVEVHSMLPSNENVAFCCPELYTCPLWPEFSICETLRYSALSMYRVDNIYSQNIIATVGLTSRPYSGSVNYDYAYPIQIRWKDGEIVSNSVISGVVTPASTSSAVSTATVKLSPRLSTGAIVAISVVLGILALISLGFIMLWVRRRRRLTNKRTQSAAPELDNSQVIIVPELKGGRSVPPELGNTQVTVVPELKGRGIWPAVELEARGISRPDE